MLLEMLKKIGKRECSTNNEHDEYLKELESMAKLFDDLVSGKVICYNGKFVAMNKAKYQEYRDKQLIFPESIAFIQDRNDKLEKLLEIMKEKPFESASAIHYLKINKKYPKMQDYEHYCQTIKDTLYENEFDLFMEVLINE